MLQTYYWLQYYKVLQSTSPVLLRTTKYSSTTKYYSVLQSTTPVLLQYYSVLRSTSPVLQTYYSSTTPYYKVLLQYYFVPRSTTCCCIVVALVALSLSLCLDVDLLTYCFNRHLLKSTHAWNIKTNKNAQPCQWIHLWSQSGLERSLTYQHFQST